MSQYNKYFFPAAWILLLAVLLAAIALGAVSITPADMLAALQHWMHGEKPGNIYEGVFLQIRLPRVLLCMVTGAVLAVSGVLMQGLFRNPIVEPGLAGTSAGAAFGASLVFALSSVFNKQLQEIAGPLLVPLFAFAGGLLATWLVYLLASGTRKMDVTGLLLTGIAVNAVGLSGTGFMSYIARDPQARSITFWNLGGFSGASWTQVLLLMVIAIPAGIIAWRDARKLNLLMLGEEDAGYAGVDTEKLKRRIILLNTAMVAVATAFAGVIGFMGLIVPHLVRMLLGSDHRTVLPASMLLGALLLTLADLGARLLLAPAEIPIGIITSLVGAPVFIVLLKKTQLTVKGGGHA